MAGVTLESVSKVFAGIYAVRDVSFAAPDRCFCVIVGPASCGKSTVLRMIAGLETASDGRISIGGRRVDALAPAARDLAMVFQDLALYPHMRIADNLAYGLRNRRTPADEIDRRVRAIAGELALSDALLARKPHQLSPPQRLRAALARALVRRPALVLLDEPLAPIDPAARGALRVDLRRLQRGLGAAALYAARDPIEAMALADMLVVMNAGTVEQIGAPMELYERPASVFVARFLGAPPMNIMTGAIEAPGRVRLENGETLGYDAAHFGPPRGAAVAVGVRPEQMGFSATDGLAFTIAAVEELGAGRLVHGAAGGAPVTVAQPSAAPAPTLRLRIAPQDVHLFDKASGVRL